MVKVLSVEAARRGTTQARVEMSNGDIYLIGFVSDEPLIAKTAYVKLLERVLDDYEKLPSGEDLYNYLSYRLAGEKAETPLFVMPDRNIDRERIGRRIRELRESKHMEAKKLARLADIDAANLSRIEQGKYSTGLDVLSKIALALDTRVDLVPSGSEEKAGSFSFFRRVWIIPKDRCASFDIYASIPALSYGICPVKEVLPPKMQIGDLAVFYDVRNRDHYSSPVILSGMNIQQNQLPNLTEDDQKNYWTVGEDICSYLKVQIPQQWSDSDEIQLRAVLARLKEEPTGIVEMKLR